MVYDEQRMIYNILAEMSYWSLCTLQHGMRRDFIPFIVFYVEVLWHIWTGKSLIIVWDLSFDTLLINSSAVFDKNWLDSDNVLVRYLNVMRC